MTDSLNQMIELLDHTPTKLTLEKPDLRMIAIWLKQLQDLKQRLAGNYPPVRLEDWRK